MTRRSEFKIPPLGHQPVARRLLSTVFCDIDRQDAVSGRTARSARRGYDCRWPWQTIFQRGKPGTLQVARLTWK
jgi:hypothetical protein